MTKIHTIWSKFEFYKLNNKNIQFLIFLKVQAFSGGGNTTGGSSGIVFDAPVAQDIEPYVIRSLCSIYC